MLVGSSLLGRLTSSGFALQDFCCAAAVSGINPTDNVVVVVALANGKQCINITAITCYLGIYAAVLIANKQ